jgi:hypothetical protein
MVFLPSSVAFVMVWEVGATEMGPLSRRHSCRLVEFGCAWSASAGAGPWEVLRPRYSSSSRFDLDFTSNATFTDGLLRTNCYGLMCQSQVGLPDFYGATAALEIQSQSPTGVRNNQSVRKARRCRIIEISRSQTHGRPGR